MAGTGARVQGVPEGMDAGPPAGTGGPSPSGGGASAAGSGAPLRGRSVRVGPSVDEVDGFVPAGIGLVVSLGQSSAGGGVGDSEADRVGGASVGGGAGGWRA